MTSLAMTRTMIRRLARIRRVLACALGAVRDSARSMPGAAAQRVVVRSWECWCSAELVMLRAMPPKTTSWKGAMVFQYR